MAPDSVSFRITRNTEDLAQTIHALSQRLVVMEQRLQAMELQLSSRLKQDAEPDLREVSSLDNVERLLFDCRALLGLDETGVEEPEQDTAALGSEPPSESPSEPLLEGPSEEAPFMQAETDAAPDSELFTPSEPFQRAA
ncbi:putative methyl-accepting chemotaxis protein [Cyanobium sp. PCC 7001]|uniref:hypothetical protein n=1 Tax=Cyanobium sp. PCC 7001 TaxID=180281 RepID=UPI0001804CA2|nr:hypothetical protein [Cyanobium sp. PCC 7001]EDY39738.1 putative methyl-accepting chemotaxis protein [Cyanobium sp. PCC 7001]